MGSKTIDRNKKLTPALCPSVINYGLYTKPEKSIKIGTQNNK